LIQKKELPIPESHKKVLLEPQPIPESHKKVLLHIAKEGPQTKYEIEIKTKINHASVHEAIKNLLNLGLVEGEKIGTTRIGLPKTKYKLNFHGLLRAIRISDLKDLDKIIEKWKNLDHLLFGKWGFLVAKIGRSEVEKLLMQAAAFVDTFHGDETILDEFRAEVLGGLYDDYRDKFWAKGAKNLRFEKWIEVFKVDAELKNYIMEYLEETLRSARKDIEWVQFLKRKLSHP